MENEFQPVRILLKIHKSSIVSKDGEYTTKIVEELFRVYFSDQKIWRKHYTTMNCQNQ